MELKKEDLRIDSFRSGNKVNETDKAIRITHIPTGITVQATEGHSIHENRAIAMALLKERVEKMQVLCDEMDGTGKNVLV